MRNKWGAFEFFNISSQLKEASWTHSCELNLIAIDGKLRLNEIDSTNRLLNRKSQICMKIIPRTSKTISKGQHLIKAVNCLPSI